MSDILEEIPWPGPRPYEEREWKIFFGRNRDVHEIHKRVVGQRLTLLSGGSGAGKTSLLRAGVVPLLRLRRYAARPLGSEKEWLVLVLRDWGLAEGERDIDRIIKERLRAAAAAIEDWRPGRALARRDARAVREAIERNNNIVDALREIVKEAGGLILIFDQMEEIVRLDDGAGKTVAGIISDLLGERIPLRLLLSLRSEQIVALRDLEREIGGLIGRTYFLPRMKHQAVGEVIRACSEAARVNISDDEVWRVLRWMRNYSEEERSGSNAQEEEEPELLSLQAVLRELFLRVRSSKSNHLVIDAALLETYEREVGGPGPIGTNALKRWIENALTTPSEGATSKRATAARLAEPALTMLVRRIGARLAPHLSSGSYKVAQEEVNLFEKSLGSEISVLGFTISSDQGFPTFRPTPSGESAPRDSCLSGVALQECWNPRKAAETLWECFLETLRRLHVRNVVKPVPGGGERRQGKRWELLHDQLGPAFSTWGFEERDTWRDAVASLVALRGISPIAVTSSAMQVRTERERSRVCSVRWEGCLITGGEGVVEFSGVDFEDCRMRGTIFRACRFKGCSFLSCDLSGVLFENCEFLSDIQGNATKIEASDVASLGFLKGLIGSLRFEGCRLTQLTIDDLGIKGELVFVRCALILAKISRIRTAEKGSVIRMSSSSLYYCASDPDTLRLIEREGGCEEVSSGELGVEILAAPLSRK